MNLPLGKPLCQLHQVRTTLLRSSGRWRWKSLSLPRRSYTCTGRGRTRMEHSGVFRLEWLQFVFSTSCPNSVSSNKFVVQNSSPILAQSKLCICLKAIKTVLIHPYASWITAIPSECLQTDNSNSFLFRCWHSPTSQVELKIAIFDGLQGEVTIGWLWRGNKKNWNLKTPQSRPGQKVQLQLEGVLQSWSCLFFLYTYKESFMLFWLSTESTDGMTRFFDDMLFW